MGEGFDSAHRRYDALKKGPVPVCAHARSRPRRALPVATANVHPASFKLLRNVQPSNKGHGVIASDKCFFIGGD